MSYHEDMTNKAFIVIKSGLSNIRFIAKYPYGMMSDLGEKLKLFLSEEVSPAIPNIEPTIYHSVDDIVHWFLQHEGVIFVEDEWHGKMYAYQIDVDHDQSSIELRYADRDLHYERKGDNDWLEEPDWSLNKRLASSEPVLVVK